jgi:hypothetical protein
MDSADLSFGSCRGLTFHKLDQASCIYNANTSNPISKERWLAIDSMSLEKPIVSPGYADKPLLLKEYLSTSNAKEAHPPNRYFGAVLNKPRQMPIHLKGSYLLTADRYTAGNMCHVVFDHLYRAWLAQSMIPSLDGFCFVDTAWDWAKYIINLVIGDSERVLYLKQTRTYFFERLYFASNSFPGVPQIGSKLNHPANHADSDFLFNLQGKIRHTLCEANSTPGLTQARKIFISRKRRAQRSFKNLREIEDRFRHSGFEVVYMEQLAASEQLALVSSCSHIAGFHGAGLSNIVAAPAGASLLEIFSNTGTDAYAKVAESLGLRYTEMSSTDSSSNLTINLHLLDDAIESFLG